MAARVDSRGRPSASSTKRKLPPDHATPADIVPASSVAAPAAAANGPKRQRVGPPPAGQPTTLPMHPHDDLLAELRGRYDVLPLSVISSSSLRRRVDRVLAHLGRFSPVDLAVLPGVALLHARAGDAGKMVSVIELARRRIHESDQKWFQYNRLYEVQAAAGPRQQLLQQQLERSVVEETVLGRGAGDGDEDDDDMDEFETMTHPTVFERAVDPQPRAPSKPYMSIFLSRVPIPELQAKDYITTQTNSDQIEVIMKKKMGLL